MSRRTNNVRGPTSALTEFLREAGINPATIARRVATRDPNQTNAQPPSRPDTLSGAQDAEHVGEQENQNETAAQPSTRRRGRSQAVTTSGYASDQLDEPEEESPAKKRKSTKGKTTAAAKAEAKKSKMDGDYEGSSEDEYKAVSKSLWSMGGNGGSKPPVGSFEKCVRCDKQFTVVELTLMTQTKYTMATNLPPGYLCHQCAKASGADPFKKPATPRKRKTATEKREVISHDAHRFPTLASLCIELIGKHIDDVEALGDIGSVNMDEIAKSLARNRGLTPANVQLFYDVRNEKLRFYDATNLTPPTLTTLANLNPNLTHLHLDYCGRLTSPVLAGFSKSLPRLTHLTLLGPFLVRSETWVEFFQTRPELRSFRITQSPRFDLECVKSLAENCTKLEELQLKEIGQLNDTFVEPLCVLPSLTSLDLSNPGTGIEESGWLQLLERHGPTLASFDPSCHEGFTDVVLDKGIRQHARAMSELNLEALPSLTDEGVAIFFENWSKSTPYVTMKQEEETESGMDVDGEEGLGPFTPNPPLHVLSLARNHDLSDATLTAILAHSAPSLVSLNLNGLGPLSTDSLGRLKEAVELRWLDISWCREMDDFIMKDIVPNMPKLVEVRLWGCSRVKGTGWAGKRGLKVYGIEPNAGS
ncbi:RNI-like protein [Gyrodon lividus]|nr:RNI-like protein [Gyrodon lividus]